MLNLNMILTDFDGAPIPDNLAKPVAEGDNPPQHPTLTLRWACIHALVVQLPEDQNISGEEKMIRGRLAQKLYDSPPSTLFKVEEVMLIKTRIGKLYNPAVIFRAWSALDMGERELEAQGLIPLAPHRDQAPQV